MNIDFSFKPKLTKELILSRFTEEQIMEYYLQVPIKKGLFCSPLREDKNPTCSVFRNSRGNLIFKDFATGQYLNVFSVVQTLYRCDFYKALRIIANDFGIIHDSSLKKNLGKINSNPIKIQDKEVSRIQVEIQDFTELELKWWKKYGITPEILKKYKVFSCKHVFLNGKLFAKSQQHCPIFGYYGDKIQENKEKIELWRIYFPKNKNYRFITNWPSKKIQGYDQLPKKGKLLVITKAMKDTMVLHSLGIPSCSPNSETQFVSDKILDELKKRFKYIVVLFDLDHTGIQFSKKIKQKYPELIVTLLPREDGCKDISDYYAKYGRKKTLEMIKYKINNCKHL